MIFTLSFTSRAILDLSEIRAYIALDKPDRATYYAQELWEEIQSLKQMPNRCPFAPEAEKKKQDIRHLIYGSYRVLFVVKRTNVKILRVIHGARVFFEIGQS